MIMSDGDYHKVDGGMKFLWGVKDFSNWDLFT